VTPWENDMRPSFQCLANGKLTIELKISYLELPFLSLLISARKRLLSR